MVGRARSYTLGFVIFTLASILCALAPNASQLILWRLVQGVGGALLMANATALVTDAFRGGAGQSLASTAWSSGRAHHGPDSRRLADRLRLADPSLVQRADRYRGRRRAGLILVEQAQRAKRIEIDWLARCCIFVGLMGLMMALAFGGSTAGRRGGSSVGSSPSSWRRRSSFGLRRTTTLRSWTFLSSRPPLHHGQRDRLPQLGPLATGVLSCWCSTSRARGAKTRDAGLMLAPLGSGSSSLADSGALADRYGSRELATGACDHGSGSRGTHDAPDDTPYWQLAFWQLVSERARASQTRPTPAR